MIFYSDDIAKRVERNKIPREIFLHMDNAFKSLDLTKDLDLFDIKQLKVSADETIKYYRIRKGKYRAIFYIEQESIYVIALDKREEVYKKWQ